MKMALIDPRQNRICQIIDPAVEDQFEVAPPLMWRPVPNDATPDFDTFDSGGYKPGIPRVVVPEKPRSETDPVARLLIAKGLVTAKEIDDA